MINFCDQHLLNFWGANARDIIVFAVNRRLVFRKDYMYEA